MLNEKQCRSRSVGFLRSQLIWIYTVCKDRVYLGSAGQGLISSIHVCPFILESKTNTDISEFSSKYMYGRSTYIDFLETILYQTILVIILSKPYITNQVLTALVGQLPLRSVALRKHAYSNILKILPSKK